jgi:hypothetical protein
MATREHFLARLLELPRIQDKEVRRGVFRQTIASLGHGESGGAPMALAGVDPRAIGKSIQIAWSDGLLDDLDFIAPAPAAAALYQIAGALPLGSERRAIGRKVLNYLYQGNADTFASLASRMAMGSTRPLVGAGIRARLAICLSQRGHADAAVDRLALAIVTRRELANDWVSTAATGALPDRRMAAQLLERAAREAARRADQGDTHPLRVFQTIATPARFATPPRFGFDAVGTAWEALLADRETLVWRHVAVARGLLSAVLPSFVEQTRALLSPDHTPTEWRRGATSLVARVAVDRQRGLGEAMGLIDGQLLRRDPGIAMAMVWGLPPVAEVEPEAGEELLEALANVSPISIADSVVELRHQVPGFGQRASKICASALKSSLSRPELDDGLSALARCIVEDLETGGKQRELLATIQAALDAFGERGTRDAYALAQRALESATNSVATLESLDVSYDPGLDAADTRRQAMGVLRDIDFALLETSPLASLLLLDRPPGSGTTGVDALDDLDARLAHWLLDPKRRDAAPEEIKTQATLHQRQLRMLLHLIDGGSTDFGDDQERRMRVRQRWILAVRAFTAYVRKQPNTRLTRAIIATVSRAFDALVRDSAAEAVDVLLYAASHFSDSAHIAIIAEASMHPDVTQLLQAYMRYVATEYSGIQTEQVRARIEAFKRFLETFPSQTTLRAEALRTTCWRLVRALSSVLVTNSLRALLPEDAGADAGPLAMIEDCIAQLQQLVVGAERRCSDVVSKSRAVQPRKHALAHAVENAVNTGDEKELLEALTATARAADATLPGPIAVLVTQILPRLATLQVDRPSMPMVPVPSMSVELPEWMPAKRIIGGFYVVRQLGGGNVGSVFVVTRAEERHDTQAQRFALKVPEYNATAARTMSEAEFLKLFREEAGALLSIPEHPNIAGFVTFDAGAKPKPILVMELVEGVSCERILSSQSFSHELALHVLDGVISGLAAMHEVGMAHLDVKPSNAILREGSGDPVLVDFGLAGRKIRAGCATLCYGAPEVWEATPGTVTTVPASAADVYAFGCCAYELITGKTLFDGPSDVAIISQHITHDGVPPGIQRLQQIPEMQLLAAFLTPCLRGDPHKRANMKQLRERLPAIRQLLIDKPWPLKLD